MPERDGAQGSYEMAVAELVAKFLAGELLRAPDGVSRLLGELPLDMEDRDELGDDEPVTQLVDCTLPRLAGIGRWRLVPDYLDSILASVSEAADSALERITLVTYNNAVVVFRACAAEFARLSPRITYRDCDRLGLSAGGLARPEWWYVSS